MEELFSLYKKTVNMLEARGYSNDSVSKYVNSENSSVFLRNFNYQENKNIPLNSIQQFLVNDGKTDTRTLMSTTFKKGDEILLLYFIEDLYSEKKISKDEIRVFGKLFADLKNCNWCVLISPGQLSTDALKTAKSLEYSGHIHVQIFYDDEVHAVPINAMLGSQLMKVLTDDEEEEFFKENRILKSQLPKISKEDPISKYYGLKIGQIIKLKRKNIIGKTYLNETYCYKLVRREVIKAKKDRKKSIKVSGVGDAC